MDVESAVAELYSLPAADFTSRRDQIAATARADNDAELARAVRALRKPTAAAALVNQLARGAPDVLADYLDLCERLRAAQARLAGDQIRDLGQQRQRSAATLVKRAVALGGGKVSSAVQQEVDATLRAAAADPMAAQAVTSGTLTRALSYAGFGEVDVHAATATPLAAAPVASPRGRAPTTRVAKRDDAALLIQRRDGADQAVEEAEAAVHRARDSAQQAAAGAQAALNAVQVAEQEVDDLRERLAQARFAVRAAQQEVATTQAASAATEREVSAAEKALSKARGRRQMLGDDDG